MRHVLEQNPCCCGSFELEIPDLKSDRDTAYMVLGHGGSAAKNSDIDLTKVGAVQWFGHDPRPVKYQIYYANPENWGTGIIGDKDQGFSRLSPYAVWTLDFTEIGNEWIDFSAIKSVKIKFIARYL